MHVWSSCDVRNIHQDVNTGNDHWSTCYLNASSLIFNVMHELYVVIIPHSLQIHKCIIHFFWFENVSIHVSLSLWRAMGEYCFLCCYCDQMTSTNEAKCTSSIFVFSVNVWLLSHRPIHSPSLICSIAFQFMEKSQIHFNIQLAQCCAFFIRIRYLVTLETLSRILFCSFK